jgi:uncharacterized protein
MPEAEGSGLLRRIIAFPLTQLVIGGGLILLVAGLGSQALSLLPRNQPVQVAAALAIAALLVLTYKGYQRWIEQAQDRELALHGALPELGAGLLFGAVLFSAMTGIVALLGGIEVLGLRWQGNALWSMLMIAILSGTFEEILIRGLVQRHVEALVGSWGALAFTSGLFGLLHLGNPDATWWSSFAIAMEAGILLGAAFMLTRRLWLAIGIHAAWNFTQGWLFSVPVSGGEAPLGLLITRRVGPDWLTGGDFGLEASAVAMVVATLAGLFLLWRAIGKGRLIAPMWQRKGVGKSTGDHHADNHST